MIQSNVAKFEFVFFTLEKSRDIELQNGISYTAFEEQWEGNYALKVDKLVTSLLRENGFWMFWYQLESSSLSTPISASLTPFLHFRPSHLFKGSSESSVLMTAVKHPSYLANLIDTSRHKWENISLNITRPSRAGYSERFALGAFRAHTGRSGRGVGMIWSFWPHNGTQAPKLTGWHWLAC